MIKEFKIPTPGESITEVEVARWMVEDGAYVTRDTELAEIESDKATLLLVAEEDGIISIKAQTGQTVAVGSVAYTLDIKAHPEKSINTADPSGEKEAKTDTSADQPKDRSPLPDPVPASTYPRVKVTPLAARMMEENKLTVEDIIEGLRRLTRNEVSQVTTALKEESLQSLSVSQPVSAQREINRQNMSPLRRKLSERLVAVKNETAMLTTFNEIDMSAITELRQQLQTRFTEKFGFKIGYMGFFTKAVALAAKEFPMVNSMIDGEEMITPSYVDIGIAVQTPKGLLVPNVRNAESKTVAQIETEIKDLALKAREKRTTIEELSGGTISITNGGVFGSLFSTPILNPPQSAILGMHNIVDRPVAVKGQVVIRPMMYVALTYDHRLIDGKDSVGFLVRVKELIEHPDQLAFQGKKAIDLLLDS